MVHAPAQHTSLAPHACASSQATHAWPAHSWPLLQSLTPQQVALPIHAPAQHNPPSHAPAAVQVDSAHWPPIHNAPAALPAQSLSVQQVPVMHALVVPVLGGVPAAQHTCELAQVAVAVLPQVTHVWLALSHTPLAQSELWQQAPQTPAVALKQQVPLVQSVSLAQLAIGVLGSGMLPETGAGTFCCLSKGGKQPLQRGKTTRMANKPQRILEVSAQTRWGATSRRMERRQPSVTVSSFSNRHP